MKKNQGSAKALSGQIYVLTVFTGQRAWAQADADSFYNKLYEALRWLTKQVRRYGKNVSFKHGFYGLPSPVTYEIGKGSLSGGVIWQMMQHFGYRDVPSFAEWARREQGCDNCLVLMVVDKPGRSSAIAYSDNYDRSKYFLEGAVCYTHHENGLELSTASIAHEICHLFGAEDLYQPKAIEQRARQLYPDDIMLRVSYNIDELSIGEMTAWFMGLSDVEKPWYRSFLPENQ